MLDAPEIAQDLLHSIGDPASPDPDARPGDALILLHDSPLRRACITTLTKSGYSTEAAYSISCHLITADRAGKSCHGLVRLPGLVKNQFGFSKWDRPTSRNVGDSLLLFDGTDRPGIFVLDVIVGEAIQLAKRTGICLAMGRNVYPSGHLGGYALKAANAGLAAHIESTSPSRVTPPGHGRPVVGTNPICRAYPTANETPVVIDLATSALTHGDLLLAAERDGVLPKEVAVRSDGTPAHLVSEFDAANGAGGILPFGQRDAYKAFALAVGVALQTSYSGSPPASRSGASFAASVLIFDPARFDASDNAGRSDWLSHLSSEEKVRIPGWQSISALRAYEQRGLVPLRRATWNAICPLLEGALTKR